VKRSRGLKRAFDVVLSILGLTVFSPAMAVIWLRMKRESDGPVLYAGRRVGLGGREFNMYKFRSMVVNADRLGGSSTSDDDPRLTAIGRSLRRYKLDELPQLLNVLRGDMSFVGPRPQVPEEVAGYTDAERLLLTVRPGITDWASLRFHNEGEILRGREDPDTAYQRLVRPEKIRLGLEYVRRATMKDDIKILVKTALLPWTRGERRGQGNTEMPEPVGATSEKIGTKIGSFSVREMRASEIDLVVDVCVAGSTPTFTFRLGPRFLRSQFKAFVGSRQGCALTCWDVEDGQLVGYVCGTQDLARHYRGWLRQNLLNLPLLAAVFWNPAMASGLVRRGRRLLGIISLRRKRASARGDPEPADAILMQVLVRPDRRHQGIGSILVQAFTDEMARRGMGRIELWVRSENTPARRLYEQLGWTPVRSETDTKGSSRWLYRLELTRRQQGIRAEALGATLNRHTATDSTSVSLRVDTPGMGQ